MKSIVAVVVFLQLFLSCSCKTDLFDYEDEISKSNETTFSFEEGFSENVAPETTTVELDEVTDRIEDYTTLNDNIDTCGDPPVIDNTKFLKKIRPPYDIRSTISYSCDFGYYSDKVSYTSTCLKSPIGGNPSWTVPNIVCIPRSCDDPGFVNNARRIGSLFTFPNSISFECDSGYKLQGSNIRFCQVNGQWSGTSPSCEKILCNHPTHPTNGRVSFSSLEYGSRLKYECDKGLLLKNHQPRFCSENGTWSGVEPECLDAQCEIPVAPEHGFVELVGGIPRVGSIAIYTCEDSRKIIGSSTSKCLDIGEWTFPTPRCVEPCLIPKVLNGRIFKKEWRRRPTEVYPGTSIKETDELLLRCDRKYEPLGKSVSEIKVTCLNGEWDETPVCETVKCKSNPPAMTNGAVSTINRNHGGGVVYHCVKFTKKIKYGNVTCHFGEWIGITPICKDTRCYMDKLRFPGLVATSKTVYMNNEFFIPSCDKGYDVAKPGDKFTCENGDWKGHLPPCTPASCSMVPPTLSHGKIKSYSEMHSSTITYECEDQYILQPSTVTCLFGEWTGSPPTCKDSRCYFSNLKFTEGLTIPPKHSTNSGEDLDVKCAHGYSLVNYKPNCSRGKWTEYGTSPCGKKKCFIARINNGAITSRGEKRTWSFGYKTTFTYKKEAIGQMIDSEQHLFVTCNYGFTFQGKNRNDVQIRCSKGIWIPTPVCLRPGTYYEEEIEPAPVVTQFSKRTTEILITEVFTLPSSTETAVRLKPPATADSVHPLSFVSEEQDEDCFCIYQGFDNLIAFSENKILLPGNKVKSGSVVKFHCLNFGIDHLMGPTEIECNDCKNWHSSEYPQCVKPAIGDTILQINWDFINVLPGGILTMERGLDVQIRCVGNGVLAYPTWRTTVHPEYYFIDYEQNHPNVPTMYSTMLTLHNTGPQHNGKYACSIAGYRPNKIVIQVLTQCVRFEEYEDLIIHYDNKQNVNSSALFTCKDKNKTVDGPRLLTCLSTGEWSGKPPVCVPTGCAELIPSEGLTVIYSDHQYIGSTATFHCSIPRVRKGNSRITCLKNGEWSGFLPSCTLSKCPMEDLYKHVPENVVPVMENVDSDTVLPGFKLDLTCEQNMVLNKPESAKCGNDGVWEVSDVRCVPGCGPFEVSPNSQLIIEPEKETYRFGELVSLSCASGQILSKEVEVLMCLRNGWSESEIPACIDTEASE